MYKEKQKDRNSIGRIIKKGVNWYIEHKIKGELYPMIFVVNPLVGGLIMTRDILNDVELAVNICERAKKKLEEIIR
jgi:hypothetical protein